MAELSDEDRALARSVQRYLDVVAGLGRDEAAATLTPLGEAVAAHLGVDPRGCSIVEEPLPDHRLVDLDAALEDLQRGSGGRTVGVTGGESRLHSSLAELLSNPHVRFAEGPADFVVRADGPDSSRRVVGFGLRLLQHDGVPIAVLQRAAAPRFGRTSAQAEVVAQDPDAALAFLRVLRERMVQLSVLRGAVLSFTPTEWGNEAGATFLERPGVSADDVVLPAGMLERVVEQVLGVSEHREVLLAAGRHLKRGVLLYGPPGTGKTLTVRHLLSTSPGLTAIVLTGPSIAFITAATELARVLQPSLVVLEDIDLVAMQRHSSPQPLLFEVLDALDGLDGDSDIAFVMTTNRVEVIERALVERPGRVDLAIEIPRPGPAERRRLFRRYAEGTGLPADAVDAAAERSEGTTGSFAKELLRRAVLRAAREGRRAEAADLSGALDELVDQSQELTRSILGARTDRPAAPIPVEEGGAGVGWTAYAPGAVMGSVLRFEPDPEESAVEGEPG